ncbi:PD-(D/E)XK nuclease family protein [Marispirochaeta aestuarii]|uniref:PD-(D/E)XK nuclease family protein n=1 Tax=Marispirochaeta aestuarii TaxID=1963862 RepID=UPI0029C7C9AB|nr:PD-(D/E)XK nuclease family protein [Marispirochaeta aestuarii]
MENLQTRIQDLLPDVSWNFVFPSEISARYWRRAVIRRGFCDAVWGSRFLSWDRFKEIAFGLTESRRPVNGCIRRLFAETLAEENRESPFLSRLLPRAEGSSGGAGELSRILPRLPGLVPRLESCSWPVADDLRELHRRYGSFLAANSLYEPSMLEPSLDSFSQNYLLCFPEVLEDYSQYSERLEAHPQIRRVSVPLTGRGHIDLFENQRLEASVLMKRIRDLLKEGTDPEEIAITLPKIDTNRRYLEEAAERYGIPLQVRTGRPLTEYASVRFFRELTEAFGSSFENAALKNLIMNAGIPWKEAAALRSMLLEGTGAYVIRNWRDSGGLHGWEEQLSRAGCTESLQLYRRLSAGIRGIVSAGSFAEVGTRLQAFIGTFLDTERWRTESPLQLRSFQRALEVLNDFAGTEEEFPSLSVPSPYAVWVAALEEESYVEQQTAAGISVYPYRASAGIDPAYHFIPFLTQDSSRVVWDRGFPLNEAQREDAGISDDDAGELYLRLYLESGKAVRVSCAENGYDGPGLPPGFFVENRLVRSVPGEELAGDPDEAEEAFFKGGISSAEALVSRQGRGYGCFYATAAEGRSLDLLGSPISHAGFADVLRERYFSGSGEKGAAAISATDLDAFWACPFAFLFTRVLGLKEEEYSPLVRDHRLEGTLLHRVLEKFSASLAGGRFLSAELDEYRMRTGEILDREAARLKGPLPVQPAWEASLENLKQQLEAFPVEEAKYFDAYSTGHTERRVSAVLDGVPVVGRIDRISRGPAGELLVVDYKKSFRLTKRDLEDGNGLPATMQIPLYVLLLEEAGVWKPGDDLICAYYSASDGKYRVVFSSLEIRGIRPMLKDDQFTSLLRTTRECLTLMQRRIGAGDYRMDPRECEGCSLRALCRGKYVVRGAV